MLEPFLGKSEYANHGQRVVEGQRLMQAASDIMLGWERVDRPRRRQARLLHPPAVGRQGLGDHRGHGARASWPRTPRSAAGRWPARTPARATPVAIASYLGSSDALRPGAGRLRRDLRRPERARLRGHRRRRQQRPHQGADRRCSGAPGNPRRGAEGARGRAGGRSPPAAGPRLRRRGPAGAPRRSGPRTPARRRRLAARAFSVDSPARPVPPACRRRIRPGRGPRPAAPARGRDASSWSSHRHPGPGDEPRAHPAEVDCPRGPRPGGAGRPGDRGVGGHRAGHRRRARGGGRPRGGHVPVAGPDRRGGRRGRRRRARVGQRGPRRRPALVASVEEALGGPVEVLVCNTGGPPAGPDPLAFSRDDWEAAHRSLVLAPMALVRAVLPGMRERGWGRILNVGSTTVREPLPFLVLSNAERSAALAAFKTLARDVAGDGVTLNTVLPGRILTERLISLAGSAEAAEASARGAVPAARVGRPRRSRRSPHSCAATARPTSRAPPWPWTEACSARSEGRHGRLRAPPSRTVNVRPVVSPLHRRRARRQGPTALLVALRQAEVRGRGRRGLAGRGGRWDGSLLPGGRARGARSRLQDAAALLGERAPGPSPAGAREDAAGAGAAQHLPGPADPEEAPGGQVERPGGGFRWPPSTGTRPPTRRARGRRP